MSKKTFQSMTTKGWRGVKSEDFHLVCLKVHSVSVTFLSRFSTYKQRCIKQNHFKDDNISFSCSSARFYLYICEIFWQIFCGAPPSGCFWPAISHKKLSYPVPTYVQICNSVITNNFFFEMVVDFSTDLIRHKYSGTW